MSAKGQQLAGGEQTLQELLNRFGHLTTAWLSFRESHGRALKMNGTPTYEERIIHFSPGDYAKEYHYAQNTEGGERFAYELFLKIDLTNDYHPIYVFSRQVPDDQLPGLLKEIHDYESKRSERRSTTDTPLDNKK